MIHFNTGKFNLLRQTERNKRQKKKQKVRRGEEKGNDDHLNGDKGRERQSMD